MKQILIETSARHLHVTKETLKTLFGEDAVLVCKKELSQPGQFASDKKVEVRGPKGSLLCSILGPERNADQVEVSFSDARALGVVAPVRESGDVKGSAPCTLVGPCGTVELTEGVIVAKRHIHMTCADAAELGVTNGQIVDVKVVTETGRALTFGDTVCRVNDSFALAMHIDTDECNAGALAGTVYGVIVK